MFLGPRFHHSTPLSLLGLARVVCGHACLWRASGAMGGAWASPLLVPGSLVVGWRAARTVAKCDLRAGFRGREVPQSQAPHCIQGGWLGQGVCGVCAGRGGAIGRSQTSSASR